VAVGSAGMGTLTGSLTFCTSERETGQSEIEIVLLRERLNYLEVVVCERRPALGDGLTEFGHRLGDLGRVVILQG
jgi:hypothetical protein